MTNMTELVDEVENRNELKDLFALQRAFTVTQLLNKRDEEQSAEPVPEDTVIVWRVECSCCGFGPLGVRKLARLKAGMVHSPQQLYAATVLLNSMGKDPNTGVMTGKCPPWSRVPEFEGLLHFGLRAGCLNREQVNTWFPMNKSMQDSKYVWAGYAVPVTDIVEADNQVIFNRETARRVFTSPILIK